MPNDRFAIFQVKSGELYKGLRGLPYKELRENHLRADVENYDQVYMSALRKKDTALSVFHRLSYKLPKDFKGRPIQTSDVIVLNVEGRVSAFYVDDHALILLPGFSNKAGDSRYVALDTENYVVDGKNGTWTAVKEIILNGIPFYIMKNERDAYASLLLVSFDGQLVADNFREYTQSIEDLAKTHLEIWQKYYENGEYLRALGDYAGANVNYSRVDGSRGNQDRDYTEEIRQTQVGKGTARNEKQLDRQYGRDEQIAQQEQDRIKQDQQKKDFNRQTEVRDINQNIKDQEVSQHETDKAVEQEIREEKPRTIHGIRSLRDNLRIMQNKAAARAAIERDEPEKAVQEEKKREEAEESPFLIDIPEKKVN